MTNASPEDWCILNLCDQLIIFVIGNFRWLYALFLAEDANFKQKAQLRLDNQKDPPLGPGWGTFVENEPYLKYVSQFSDRDEVHLSCCHFGTNNNFLRFHIVRAFRRCQEPIINNQKACGPLV